jgi:hypothetical protein
MLATKTGIRRHGEQQGNYRNLVWLGRPANVASKLTDLANKPGEGFNVPMVSVAYDPPQGGALETLFNPFGFVPNGSGLFGSLAPSIPSPGWATRRKPGNLC